MPQVKNTLNTSKQSKKGRKRKLADQMEIKENADSLVNSDLKSSSQSITSSKQFSDNQKSAGVQEHETIIATRNQGEKKITDSLLNDIEPATNLPEKPTIEDNSPLLEKEWCSLKEPTAKNMEGMENVTNDQVVDKDGILDKNEEITGCDSDELDERVTASDVKWNKNDESVVDQICDNGQTECSDKDVTAVHHISDLAFEICHGTEDDSSKGEVTNTGVDIDMTDTKTCVLGNGQNSQSMKSPKMNELKDLSSVYSQESQMFEVHPEIGLNEEIVDYITTATSASSRTTEEDKIPRTNVVVEISIADKTNEVLDSETEPSTNVMTSNKTEKKMQNKEKIERIIPQSSITNITIIDKNIQLNQQTTTASCEAKQLADCNTDTDDITDSQLCAMDCTVMAENINHKKYASPLFTKHEVPVYPVNKPTLPSGTTILKGLIQDISQLNMMILRTKREIETVRRHRSQKQNRPPVQTTNHNNSWFHQ